MARRRPSPKTYGRAERRVVVPLPDPSGARTVRRAVPIGIKQTASATDKAARMDPH